MLYRPASSARLCSLLRGCASRSSNRRTQTLLASASRAVMAGSAPYTEDPGYRAMVMSAQKGATTPILSDALQPAVQCLRYHHLGLVCRDPAASAAWYAKLGFVPVKGSESATSSSSLRLRGASGLELYLIQATAKGAGEPTNVLMDNATTKYPGHTHASWTVPSVPGVKTFLASLGISLSGTRSTLAVFVRDPDRTTLEFERNDGGDDPAETFTPALIGAHRTLDHVGIRVKPPYDQHVKWYAKHLGFTRMVRKYEPDDDALKNGPPWITRTPDTPSGEHVDINFILNCNAGGPAEDNLLVGAGWKLSPGILYAALTIADTDAAAACAKLRESGVTAVVDTEMGASWCNLPRSAVPLFDDGPTVLVRDLNGTFVRLVPTRA